jgi:hypothetical protein
MPCCCGPTCCYPDYLTASVSGFYGCAQYLNEFEFPRLPERRINCLGEVSPIFVARTFRSSLDAYYYSDMTNLNGSYTIPRRSCTTSGVGYSTSPEETIYGRRHNTVSYRFPSSESCGYAYSGVSLTLTRLTGSLNKLTGNVDVGFYLPGFGTLASSSVVIVDCKDSDGSTTADSSKFCCGTTFSFTKNLTYSWFPGSITVSVS